MGSATGITNVTGITGVTNITGIAGVTSTCEGLGWLEGDYLPGFIGGDVANFRESSGG